MKVEVLLKFLMKWLRSFNKSIQNLRRSQNVGLAKMLEIKFLEKSFIRKSVLKLTLNLNFL